MQGDTETPENEIPPNGFPGRDWETCMTMNGSWGFSRGDENWKSAETLIRNLCDIASKGGNYLLNVGPTSEGLIPQPSVERLNEMGRWLRVNGEAIYGCGPTPYTNVHGSFHATKKDRHGKPEFIPVWDWRVTTKPGKIYVHIFDWPKGKLPLPPLKQKITRAYLLADPKRGDLKFQQTETGITITLPEKAPDPIATVVCLETK
jgi:alpha-L-fucosidase